MRVRGLFSGLFSVSCVAVGNTTNEASPFLVVVGAQCIGLWLHLTAAIFGRMNTQYSTSSVHLFSSPASQITIDSFLMGLTAPAHAQFLYSYVSEFIFRIRPIRAPEVERDRLTDGFDLI